MRFAPHWRAETVPLLLSVAGLVCLAVSVTSPDPTELTGRAFGDAFEADEDLMLWGLLGLPLTALGFLFALLFYRGTHSGKAAIAVALAAAVWVYLHSARFG